MTKTFRSVGFRILLFLLLPGCLALGQLPLEVFHRVTDQGGGATLVQHVGPEGQYQYPFEYVVRGSAAGIWVFLHTRVQIDATNVPASSSFSLSGLYAAYPWLAPISTPLSTVWTGAVVPQSAQTLVVGQEEVSLFFNAALGAGSPLAPPDRVRPIYQPILWNGFSPLDRTWDIGCQSWLSYSTATSQPDPKAWWRPALVPKLGSNTTLMDPRSLFDLGLARQAGSWTAAQAFLNDLNFGSGALIGNGVTVTIVSQAMAVTNPGVLIPGFTDNDTFGLFSGEPTVGELLLAVSPPSSFRFHLGLPLGTGGPGFGAGSIEVAPHTLLTATGAVRIDLPVTHVVPPMTVVVTIDGAPTTVTASLPRPGWLRVLLPDSAQGATAEVLQLDSPAGSSFTVGSGWSPIALPLVAAQTLPISGPLSR